MGHIRIFKSVPCKIGYDMRKLKLVVAILFQLVLEEKIIKRLNIAFLSCVWHKYYIAIFIKKTHATQLTVLIRLDPVQAWQGLQLLSRRERKHFYNVLAH